MCPAFFGKANRATKRKGKGKGKKGKKAAPKQKAQQITQAEAREIAPAVVQAPAAQPVVAAPVPAAAAAEVAPAAAAPARRARRPRGPRILPRFINDMSNTAHPQRICNLLNNINKDGPFAYKWENNHFWVKTKDHERKVAAKTFKKRMKKVPQPEGWYNDHRKAYLAIKRMMK